jgi:hypothetical protein
MITRLKDVMLEDQMDKMASISHQDQTVAQARWSDFLPLVITLEDENWGCVAGIDSAGAWLRPSPIPARWADDPAGPFRYRVWSKLSVLPHPTSNRPEDRLLADPPTAVRAVDTFEYRNLLTAIADADVDTVFSGNRSVGLVRARIESIYARRHTRGRSFLRVVYDDDAGERFDWIVPEVATCKALAPHIREGVLDAHFAEAWLNEIKSSELFLAIGLTLPKQGASDRYGGCQPLVVGFHRLEPSPNRAAEAAGVRV